eukprot:gene12446-15650_t
MSYLLTDSYSTDFLKRSTSRRLAELERTRQRVEDLELLTYSPRRYPEPYIPVEDLELLTYSPRRYPELELERSKLDILSRLSRHYSSLRPLLSDMSDYVSELKAYLKAVYDADLVGDSLLQEIATEHCLGFTVKLMDALADGSHYSETGTYGVLELATSTAAMFSQHGTYGVLELATSTAAMFSQRAYAVPMMYDNGAVAVLIRLLSPVFPSVCVVHVANALGNLSSDLSCRLTMRSGGGVGALVRLLRSDVEGSVQAAAAAAISLLAARDMVVQDSVRLLGGVDLLVDLLASDDIYVSEVARYCLISVRHGNIKNQTEIITSMRTNPLLAQNILKMDAASELLSFEDRTPAKSLALTTRETRRRTSSAAVRSLLEDLDLNTTMKSMYRSPGRSSLRMSEEWSLGTRMQEVEDGLMRKRHVMNLGVDELCLLLEEAGFNMLDLRQIRRQRIDGRALMDMSEDELLYEILLTHSKTRKVKELQRATKLYDRMATLPRQGKMTEVEMRLYLAGQGASSTEISKIIRLVKTLVKTDFSGYFSYWDFVLGYDWIKQALHIYALPA